MNVINVDGLSKTYGKGTTQVHALNGVSFGVNQGEFVAVVGKSGSGKSTLLHMLGGLDRPSGGYVHSRRGRPVRAEGKDGRCSGGGRSGLFSNRTT